jgi:hypothetical protein
MMTRFHLALSFLLVSACALNENGDPVRLQSTETMALSGTTPAAVASKYSFVLNGTVVSSTTDVSRVHRTSTGSLVEFTGTGAVMAWSVPNAPEAGIGWPASLAVHDQMARDYFAGLGISTGELSDLTHFSGHSKGAPTSNPDAVQVTDLGYSTSFKRNHGGFAVVDSRASVQLNATGQAVGFHVFWPDVPSSVLAEAQRLQGVLSGGWSAAAGTVQPGWTVTKTYVAIHHSLAGDPSLTWRVTIRLELVAGTKTSYVDCDASGGRLYVYGGTTPSHQNRP